MLRNIISMTPTPKHIYLIVVQVLDTCVEYERKRKVTPRTSTERVHHHDLAHHIDALIVQPILESIC